MEAPDVLLLEPPRRARPSVMEILSTRMPSLGLASIAGTLEARGHRVAVVDCAIEGLAGPALSQRLKPFRGVRLIGITATTSTSRDALALATLCRRLLPDARIVMGGVHPTVRPGETLACVAVDYVVRGEGESAMADLVEGAEAAGIEGLSYRLDGAVVHNPDRTSMVDLETLPPPAYHLFPLRRYRPGLGTARRFPAISMIVSRGCPGRCTYCFRTFGTKLRALSAPKIIERIEHLRGAFGYQQFQFFDDTFTLSRARVREFCDAALTRELNISWVCYARVDTVDRPLLELMARAGCHQICFGVESGDPAILKAVRKRIKLPRVAQVVKWTQAAGIQARGTFMLGNPGETAQSMQRTMALSRELGLDLALFNITTPYPGTDLYDWADAQGLIKTRDWSLYDRSRMVMDLPTVDSRLVERNLSRAYRGFYGRPRFLARQGLKRSHWRGLAASVGLATPRLGRAMH